MKFRNEGFPNEKIINYRREQIQIEYDETYVTDIGYYPQTKMHKVIREKGIDENIICICSKGKGYVKTDEMFREINSGEYFIIPKNCKHKYFSGIEDGWGLYFIHIGGVNADNFCQANIMRGRRLKERELNLIYTLINNSVALLENDPKMINVKFVNQTIEYLLQSINVFELNKQTYNKQEELLFRFLNYLEVNITKKISIYNLLDHLNVSQGTLYKVVKEKYGVTPMQYVCKMKLNVAADMLITTNYKVSKIANLVGFEDQYHFSKKFKQITSLSPSNFRLENKKI